MLWSGHGRSSSRIEARHGRLSYLTTVTGRMNSSARVSLVNPGGCTMTRTLLLTVAMSGLGAAAVAQVPGALPQPGQPRQGPIQFRQFGGVSPEQFQQSAAARGADQVILELTELKTEVNGSRLGFGQKAAITTRADSAITSAQNLRQMARQNRPRPQLNTAYADLERTVGDLSATIAQNPVARQVAGE